MRTPLLRFLGVCLAAFFLRPTTIVAQAPDDARDWFITPLPSGPPTAEDAAARREVLQQIQDLQTDAFRKQYELQTSEHASGVPADYDILVYGVYGGRADRLEIQVRGGHARGEYFGTHSDWHWAGEGDAGSIHSWTRQLVYAALVNHSPRTPPAQVLEVDTDDDPTTIELIENEGPGRVARKSSYSFTTHVYHQRIEIRSRDLQRPFHLRTEARQPNVSRIDLRDSGMRGYAHGVYIQQLQRWIFAVGKRTPLKDAPPQEVVRRLEDFTRSVQAAGPRLLEQIRRDDREPLEAVESHDFDEDGVQKAIVEARILGAWAVAARARGAGDILERLGRTEQAQCVRITTADDGGALWRQTLTDADWSRFSLTLETLESQSSPLAIEILLDSIPRLPDEYRAKMVLHSLEGVALTPDQLNRIRTVHRESKFERARLAAAYLLLRKTDEDELYRELCQKAREPRKLDGSDVSSIVNDAIYAVVEHTNKTPARRAETAALIRSLLDIIPADAHETYSLTDYFAVWLGEFGDQRDLQRLESLATKRSAYLATMAIEGISNLDGPRASELARRQIQRFLDGSQENASYRWSVMPYLELFFWQRDQAAVPLLEKAIARWRQAPQYAKTPLPKEEALLDYLRAERPEDQKAAGRRFFQLASKHRPEWFTAVAPPSP
ncbi:MAG: hypothetical protein U0939_04975 [Pirellulales bacterium]